MPTDETTPVPAKNPPEDRLACAFAIRGGRAGRHIARILRQLSEVDRAIYTAVAVAPTPELDEPIRRLSRMADDSRLWLVIAAGICIFGGPAGKRAAMRALLTVSVTSGLVNVGIKSAWPRRRPARAESGVPRARHVRMPASRSFPSGHSAAGFAFATSVGHDIPLLALPLRLLAGAVAYSRIHTGVHYPGDVVVGSIVGSSIAQTVAVLAECTPPRLLPPVAADSARRRDGGTGG